MPNQNEHAPYYFNLSNYERSEALAAEIAENYHLNRRNTIKDYGHLKVDEDYSNSYISWSDFTDDYLFNKRSLDNPAYTLWHGIHSRCYNPNSIGYCYYGGRGIVMADEWKNDFSRFIHDVVSSIGKKPHRFYSIERISNDGNYVMGNIQWAAPTKQMRNKATTKISELSGLTLARLYKYFRVTGVQLKDIYNQSLAEEEHQKITKSWGSIYQVCRTYCQLV